MSSRAIFGRRSRRALIAASSVLAAGGVLASAGAASAAQLPYGTPTDPAYSGIGPATSLYSVTANAPAMLASAANLLQGAGDTAMANGGTAWAASDFSDVNNTADGNNISQTIADFLDKRFNVSYKPTPGTYLQKLKATDPRYADDAAQIEQTGELYISLGLMSLASDTPGYPGGNYSANGNMQVTSKATVTSTTHAAAYTMTLGMAGAANATATAGFTTPQAETISYPASFHMNLGILKNAIPYSDIANPTASGKQPIGSLMLNSPLAFLAGGAFGTKTVTGSVYLVTNPNPRNVTPYMELFFDGNYVIGKLSRPTFPMTVTFGEPFLGTTDSPMALPMSSLTVSFPAATSPFVANSCSKLTAPTATVTDYLAPFAADFGDYSDGYNTVTHKFSGVKVRSVKTTVTNHCRR